LPCCARKTELQNININNVIEDLKLKRLQCKNIKLD
jgi:hypothetical protein